MSQFTRQTKGLFIQVAEPRGVHFEAEVMIAFDSNAHTTVNSGVVEDSWRVELVELW